MGGGASWVLAPVFALRLGRSIWPLAEPPDEPDQPGPVRRLFLEWVRECWPASPNTIAIDGKTVRRSHDRSAARAALHLVSAFACDAHLVLGQEAVDDKSNETTAIPVLLEKLAVGRSLQGALVTIDAIACNPAIAGAIRDVGADYLLAVKGNQPTLKAEIEAAFQTAMAKDIEVAPDIDKGHGRIETRLVSVMRQVDWLHGDRRFPGELRFPDACAIVRIDTRTELKDRCRFDARYYITSSARSAARLGEAGRGHWGIENKLHWTLDVTFQEDFSRVRKGHGAQNMALVRKFSINKLRTAPQPQKPANLPVKPCASLKSRLRPWASSSAESWQAGATKTSPKSSSQPDYRIS